MEIKTNVSLKTYNTFGIDANAAFFAEINSVAELKEALQLDQYPAKFVLSGGSNMLLTKDIDALVLYVNMKGIEVINETSEHVILRVMAGENWHQMVLWTLDNGYGGLENLSLIPGNTGTAPIQNIGAYGVELKDTFHQCEAMTIATQELQVFSKEDCQFGYRDSYFKGIGKGKHIITSVSFQLTKTNHATNTSYGAIEKQLQKEGVKKSTIKDISNAVVAIRQSKLPDPKEIGNSGSFFKNPVISLEAFKKFQNTYPEAPFYKITETSYKVPAGWLIEQCGFKGKRFGDAGVHAKQALVLVNYGNATGQEILDLARKIQQTVRDQFGIQIETEVNIIK